MPKSGITFFLLLTILGSAIADVFESDYILEFWITITPQNWEKMQPMHFNQFRPEPPPNANDRPFRPPPPPIMAELDTEYVPTDIRFDGRIWKDVGVRFKGNSSLKSMPNGLKKPFKFDFDRFIEGQDFFGYQKLNFSNGFKDPSFLREKLAYHLFQKLDVPAPRTVFAKLYLTVDSVYDQEYLGLYTMIEQVDRVFLVDHFGNDDGLLVKPDRIPDLIPLGGRWKNYEQRYTLKSRKKDSDTGRLISFLEFLHKSDDAQFAEQIEHYFNVDSFLKLMAINTVLVNLDSYFGTGHNYYLYHDTRTDQYNMIPWDLNEAFGNFQQGQANRLLDMDINHPSIGRRMLVERLLIIEDYRFEYHRNLQALIDIEFHPETMALEIDRLANLIQEAVIADQHKQFSTRMFEQSLSEDLSPRDQGRRKRQRGDNRRNRRPPPPMLDVIFGLKTFVERRVESIDSQLNGRRTGKILEPMRRPRPKEQRPFQ